MNTPLLTICIPTFNRAVSLDRLLRSLSREAHISQVSIAISDNNSSDDTEDVIAKFVTKNSHIHAQSFRQKTNVGFDANIAFLYCHAQTQYVWFLSDDDELIPGSIQRVLEMLKAYSPQALYPNQIIDENKPAITARLNLDIVPFIPTGICMEIITDTPFQLNSDQDRMIMSRLLSFISTCIVRVDPSIFSKLRSFIGTGIMQDAIVSLSLMKSQRVMIMSQPCIHGTHKKVYSHWFMQSTLFGVDALYHNPILKYSSRLSNLVGTHTCAYGLTIIAIHKALNIPCELLFSRSLLFRIVKTYRLRSFYLAPFILAAACGTYAPVWASHFLSYISMKFRNK